MAISKTKEIIKPWTWRKGKRGGFTPYSDTRDSIDYFHAHDVNNNAACQIGIGLMTSCEEPNEGSIFCPDCIEFVKENPAGRDKRFY